MASPAWGLFVAVAGLVTAALVALSRTPAVLDDADDGPDRSGDDRNLDTERAEAQTQTLPSATLLVNVAVSQGAFASLLVLVAWYARIPLTALGLGADGVGVDAVLAGVALGGLLYAADELLAGVGARLGVHRDPGLRAFLAPESSLGWTLLLVVVLPVVAGFEELLFRGVLVGVLAVGYGVSAWALAVASSVAFGLAHGTQGAGGAVIAGVLGFALAAAFVVTGSLLAVIVAHYLVNALEFVVHERFDVEWATLG